MASLGFLKPLARLPLPTRREDEGHELDLEREISRLRIVCSVVELAPPGGLSGIHRRET